MRRFLALVLCALTLACPIALAQDYSGVTLYVVDINSDTELYDEMIDVFVADHPGITVETNHAANDNAEVMSNLIAAGNTPNIFVATPELISVYKEYLYDWRGDTAVLDKFMDGYIASITTPEGGVYGLPNGCINVGLVYNKEILAQAGYEDVPLTMEGFAQMCADVFEKTGVVPFVVSGKDGWMLAQMQDAYIVTKDRPGSVAGKMLSAGETTVSQVSGHFSNFWRMMDIATAYTPGETLLEYDWEHTCNLLAHGKVAMMTYGDWSYRIITNFNPEVKLGFSSYPVSDNADEAVTPTSTNQVALLFKDVENFEAAKELAAFLTASYASAKYIISDYGSVSCNKASADVDPALMNDLLQQSMAVGATGRAIDRMQNYYPTALNANYMNDAGEAIQGYLLGLYTEEEADQMIDDAWPVG